jgi:hypothetical protein
MNSATVLLAAGLGGGGGGADLRYRKGTDLLYGERGEKRPAEY